MTGMENAIEQTAQVVDSILSADPQISHEMRGDEPDRIARALAEAGYLAITITRDDIDRALINVTSNAMNYPTPSQMLGKDSGPLRRKCVDAMCELFGIED